MKSRGSGRGESGGGENGGCYPGKVLTVLHCSALVWATLKGEEGRRGTLTRLGLTDSRITAPRLEGARPTVALKTIIGGYLHFQEYQRVPGAQQSLLPTQGNTYTEQRGN